jgi:hypothetical protein
VDRAPLRLWTVVTAAALVIAAAAGCSREQGTASPAPAPASAPASSSAQATPAEVEPLVRATFESYVQALRSRDGTAAAALVSSETIDYYGELAALAGTGGPEEIRARSLVDRLTIALLRALRPPAELATLDGRELFVYGVEAGLIDESTVAANDIGAVRVDGDRAYATLVVSGQETPVDYEFARSGDEWLLDFVPVLERADAGLREIAMQAGQSEDEFIFTAVETVTGRPVDASIFARP